MRIIVVVLFTFLLTIPAHAQTIVDGDPKIIKRSWIDDMKSRYPNDPYSKVHVALPCNWMYTIEPVATLRGLYAAPDVDDESQYVSASMPNSYTEASGGYAIVYIADADKQNSQGQELKKVEMNYKINKNRECKNPFGFSNFGK